MIYVWYGYTTEADASLSLLKTYCAWLWFTRPKHICLFFLRSILFTLANLGLLLTLVPGAFFSFAWSKRIRLSRSLYSIHILCTHSFTYIHIHCTAKNAYDCLVSPGTYDQCDDPRPQSIVWRIFQPQRTASSLHHNKLLWHQKDIYFFDMSMVKNDLVTLVCSLGRRLT